MAKAKKDGSERKKRTPAPADESKRDKFLRLGGIRVAKALKAIGLIGNLSGSGYEYTEADLKKLDAAFDAKLKETFARFQPRKPGQVAETAVFKFED